MLAALLLAISLFLPFVICKDATVRPPSVFRAEEVKMHKYSAILAVTEPTRLQSQEQIRKSINGLKYLYYRFRGVPVLKQAAGLRLKNKGVDVACSTYEKRVESALRSYRMSVDEFNDITNQVNAQSRLKHKVLRQAHYYKVAADMEENLKPVTPLYPTIGGGFSLLRFKLEEAWDKDSSLSRTFSKHSSQLSRFANALLRIERERQRQRSIIKTDLNIRELPVSIGDPSLQPALSPVIQKTVEAFPKVVSGIVQESGLFVEEFNDLYRRMKSNPFFKYSVEWELSRLTKKMK